MDVGRINSPNTQRNSYYWEKYRSLTMPTGALGGLLEPVLNILQQKESGSLSPAALLFAASHGVTEKHRVSAYPSTVTAQMILNFLQGGAAMSVLTKRRGIPLWVVDAGVAGLQGEGDRAQLSKGTHFISSQLHSTFGLSQSIDVAPALSEDHFLAAWNLGVQTVDTVLKDESINLVLLGEMGIGNSTLATAIACGCLGLEPEGVIGPGTGLDSQGMALKLSVIGKALGRHWEEFGKGCSPLDILRSLGGSELTAMAGAAWRAASRGVHVLMDGAICTAALCPLVRSQREITQWLMASHLSPEPIHKYLLEDFGLKPLLNAQLRLGEGSGAALVLGLFQDAEALLKSMATFSSAQVDTL